MNFINNILLRVAMLPKGLYKKMGANVAQLQAILATKLLIDNRRPFSFKSMGRQQAKETNNSSVMAVLISLLMGAFFCMAFAQKGLELQTMLYFAMIICMLAALLITDFTSVLIDVRDNYIILPKPVNDQTVVLARVLHIMLHITKIAVPMALPGIITVAVMYGVGTMLVFILMFIFCVCFSLFLINLIYVLILRVVPPERFKTIISFIQILLAIVVYGGYQFVPRYLSDADMNFDSVRYKYLIPPCWFASAMKVLTTFSGTKTEILSTVLAVVFPVAALFIMVRFLAPSFNKKISSINTVTDGAPRTINNNMQRKAIKRSYSDKVADMLIKDKTEKGGFLFSWKIGSRSRDFYMKVYPAFGYLIVMCFVIFFTNKKIDFSSLSHLTVYDTQVKYATIAIVYFTGFILLSVIAQIPFSDKYKAAWMFYTTPLRSPGKILSGTLKSIVMKFYFPVMLVITIAAIALFGWRLLPDIFLGFSNVILVISLMFYWNNKDFPFSVSLTGANDRANVMVNLFRMFLMGIIGLAHYFIFSFPVAVVICLALSLLANWLLMDSIGKISWQKIKQIEI